jgi:transcriptional regulator with XRE-family HTH domain
MSFGERLAEERKRLGLKQAEFAALVGTDVPKQSLYENDRRELRADYLARLAAARCDIVYIVTGRRSDGDWLGAEPSEMLSDYLNLPPDMRRVLEQLAHGLREQFARDGKAMNGVAAPGREAMPSGDRRGATSMRKGNGARG